MNPTLTRESRAKKILDMALASDEKGAKRKIPIKKDSDAESQRISKSVVNVGSTSVNNALPDYVNLPWDELEGILQANWTAVKETIRARKKLFLPTDLPLRSPQQTQNSTETEFNLLEDIYSNELPTSFEKNESSREKRECFTLTSSQTTCINSTEGCIEIPSLESVQEVCIIAPPFSSNENNFKNKTPPSTPRHIRSYNEDTLKTHCLDKEFLISLSPAEIECLPDLALPKRIVTESPFPDPIVIVVPADSEKNVTDNKGKGKRRYDRKNYCIYCECLVLNFRRHMLRRHKNEQPIAKYLAMFETCSENSKCMRGQILEELRNKGNFIYNRKVLKESHGNDLTEQLIPVKRSGINTTKSFDDYVTCVSCQALLSKKSFYKHAPKCAVNKTTTVKEQNDDCDSDDSCLERPRKCPNFVKKYGILTYPDYPELTKLMKEKIFPLLNKDDVGKAALGDPLILQLTSDFLSNHNNRKNFYSITRKMRDGAKLLLTIKQKDSEILQFEDCFKPSKINIVLQSVKEMCGCEEDGNVRVIGMPARLAWIINESCARILDNVITSDAYTDEQKEIQKREVMDFKSVVNRRWRYIVSTNAEVSRKRKKLLKPVVMPEDSDIKKFAGFIKELEIKMYEELKSKISVTNYEALCEATIAHIITLCRRRPAEAASAELSYYINRNKDNYVSSEVVGTLSSEEKVAMANLDMFIVPGKNERHVPVLLTEQMKKNIDLIISCRKKLKIPNSNKYIFARPGLESNFIGSHILDKLRKQCPGLNKPNYLTATGLRHHCATVSQVHGDQFTEYLSQFMGHNKDIHKKNYQFPLSLIQKGILGNQMLLMEGSVPESATIINNKDDQINLEIQGLSHNRESNTTMADKNIENHVYDFLEDAGTSSNDEVSKPHISIRRKKRWTEEEKDIVIKEFSIYIRNKSNPGLKMCADLILKNPVLASRTSQQINTMIDNIIRGKLKLPCRYKHLKDV